MGQDKNGGESDARRVAREAARQKNAAVEKKGDSRRGFLRKASLIAAGVAAAGGTFWATRQEKEEAPSKYLTEKEAVKVYQQLQKQVESKWQEAQAKGKPLKIFVFEGHTSVNALAYELMLTEIGRGLGINTMLVELGENSIEEIMAADSHTQPFEIAKIQKVIQNAADKNYNITDIDRRFATHMEDNHFRHDLIRKLAESEMNRRFPGHTIKVILDINDDNDSPLSPFTISHIGLTPEQLDECGPMVIAAEEKAYGLVLQERNQTMLRLLRQYPSAIVINGQQHAQELLTTLRKEGEMDIAFCVSDRALELKVIDSGLSDELRAHKLWAMDPANAIQFRGKEFSPKETAVFIERVIEKANSRANSIKGNVR